MEFDNVNVSVRKLQGNVGVARAIYEYTKRGNTVLMPWSDSDKYDLVIDDGVSLHKVQVKTSRCKANGGYAVNLATKGGNTSINKVRTREVADYDILFCLTEDGNCWSIPVTALGDAKHSIVVTSDKYKAYRLI